MRMYVLNKWKDITMYLKHSRAVLVSLELHRYIHERYITMHKGDIGCIHLPRNRWYDLSLSEPVTFTITEASQIDYLMAFEIPCCIASRYECHQHG